MKADEAAGFVHDSVHKVITGPAGQRTYTHRAALRIGAASVLRRQMRAGTLNARRARLALDDLAALPARRAPHRPLLTRCWELRDNLTIYDAAYVALAEAMSATLLTGDQKLARAPGPQCHIEVFQPAS